MSFKVIQYHENIFGNIFKIIWNERKEKRKVKKEITKITQALKSLWHLKEFKLKKSKMSAAILLKLKEDKSC